MPSCSIFELRIQALLLTVETKLSIVEQVECIGNLYFSKVLTAS